MEDLQVVEQAIDKARRVEAEDKLSVAQAAIDQYFRRMTGHPTVRAIKLTRPRSSYEITDQDGKDIRPILSQGDLNALALAIFLGLAASSGGSGPFGFVLLDDPSQSLDSEHKKQLVEVLNEVAGKKQLILATMDREFRDALEGGLRGCLERPASCKIAA